MKLVGANRDATVEGTNELPGKVNYFLGNDPKTWRRNVPTYAKVRYQNVYRGVDLVYYGNQAGQLEYDFVVAPGADPAAITLDVEAHGSPARPPLRIARDGDLIVDLDGGDVRFHKPVVYQPAMDDAHRTSDFGLRTAVDGHYVLTASNQVRFALGPYDRNQPLVIDPVLSYSTYLGGSGGETNFGIAVDSSGNAYVTGLTQSAHFPTTGGAYQTTPGSTQDAFVAKLQWNNSTATLSLAYSTYLGGNGDDFGYSVAVDSSFNAYVAGSTASTNFPTTPGALATSPPGSLNAFVAKLSADGSSLVYSTYLGGSQTQEALGIAVDSGNAAYVTGYTSSSNFPVSHAPTAYYAALNGTQNAFVAELNPAGSALVYSIYLGGNNTDQGYGIAVDNSGNAYVAGTTSSATFPVHNALYPSLNGSQSDAFVAKLNWSSPTLSLVYSTYLGGTGQDEGFSLALDSSGSAYVTGATTSTNFPTSHPYQSTNNTQIPNPAATGTVFVSRLDWNASSLTLGYSTYLGGSALDWGYGIAVDSSGNAYVTGVTASADFPTQSPLYSTLTGSDAFVTKLHWDGSTTLSLAYSTYLGGSLGDSGYAIALDSSGNAYVTGITASTDFPTFCAVQKTNNTPSTSATGFVAKISPSAVGTASLSATSIPAFASQVVNSPPSSPQHVTLTNTGSGPLTIASIAISGQFALDSSGTCPITGGTLAASSSCTIAVNFDPTTVGAQAGTVTITDNSTGIPTTQTVSLSGTGTASTSGVSLSTPSAFAGQFVGTTSSAETVTLTNGGSASLSISAIVVTGPFNLATSGTTCSTSTPVAANGTCAVAVTFSPTAAGSASGNLTVTDNGIGSPQSVSLSGTGWDYTLAMASGSSSTATVAPGATATYTLNLTGLGGFTQTVTFSCAGAPSEANCTASSASASSTGTAVTVTVTTTAPSAVAPRSRPLPPVRPLLPGPGSLVLLAMLLTALAWAARTWWQPGASRLRIALVALALGMLLTLAMAACGGGGGGGGGGNAGTPAGTSTLTVTGTGTAGTGTTTKAHTQTLTLTVS
jgi:hypothetical protein